MAKFDNVIVGFLQEDNNTNKINTGNNFFIISNFS